jgi:hypothetical protein
MRERWQNVLPLPSSLIAADVIHGEHARQSRSVGTSETAATATDT